jgi:hypothetical protein
MGEVQVVDKAFDHIYFGIESQRFLGSGPIGQPSPQSVISDDRPSRRENLIESAQRFTLELNVELGEPPWRDHKRRPTPHGGVGHPVSPDVEKLHSLLHAPSTSPQEDLREA